MYKCRCNSGNQNSYHPGFREGPATDEGAPPQTSRTFISEVTDFVELQDPTNICVWVRRPLGEPVSHIGIQYHGPAGFQKYIWFMAVFERCCPWEPEMFADRKSGKPPEAGMGHWSPRPSGFKSKELEDPRVKESASKSRKPPEIGMGHWSPSPSGF